MSGLGWELEMRYRNRRLLVLVAVIAACSGATADENSAPPVVQAERTLRIGSVDDTASALTVVREIVVGRDGRIFSLHPQEHAVRIHDANGRLLRRFGREGSGPGEFDSPSRIGLRGDTIWVFDHGTYRFTLFDSAGELIESRAVPIDVRSESPRPRGMLHDGTVWGSPPYFSEAVATGDLTRGLDVRLDSAGRVLDTLIEYSVANTSWRLHDPSNPGGIRRFSEQPFNATEMVVLSEHRPEIVIVERPIATTEARGEFRVTKRALDGDTIYSRAFAYLPQPIPAKMVDSLVEWFVSPPSGLPPRMAASWPAPGRREELARASLFLPEYLPPVKEVVVGRDGAIWIQRYGTGGATREWWVMDDEGRAVASVQLPAGMRVLAAERDRVWGTKTDELDVPYIVRYEVRERS